METSIDHANDSLNNEAAQCEEDYGARIARLQEECLIPLKEDLAEWLNRIFEVEDITFENFMFKLDNGVIVCKLAKLIQERCDDSINEVSQFLDEKFDSFLKIKASTNGQIKDEFEQKQSLNKSINKKTINNVLLMKCWENARPRSFYARDNVCNFLKWCRKFGVRDAVLFESDDLVSHVNQRNVVLCLLEVARIACTKHYFSPAPGLVQLEQEIDQLEAQCHDEIDEGNSINGDKSLIYNGSSNGLDQNGTKLRGIPVLTSNHNNLFKKAEVKTPYAPGICSSKGSFDSINSETSTLTKAQNIPDDTNNLDHKVMSIAKTYYGKDIQRGIKRLSEGKYQIAGRIVFVRLLKARHVMVRVGGGWDTLHHFLERHHGDPTHQISPSDLLPLDTRPSFVSPRCRPETFQLVSSMSTTHLAMIPTYKRCSTASTPVSRRSSLSSPEPWMSTSSGYSTSSNTCSAPVDEATDHEKEIKVPVTRRLSTTNDSPSRRRDLQHRASLGSSFPSTGCLISSPAPSRPLSELCLAKSSRYPNYLSSSQHITRRSSSSQQKDNKSSPIITPPKDIAKQSMFNRKTFQKAVY